MYQRILVPIDGSPTATRGLEEALALAKLTGARVRLLHHVDATTYASGFETYAAYTENLLPAMRAHGEAVLAAAVTLAAQRGVAVESQLREVFSRRVADVVAEEAAEWKADLIVIGTHGRRGASRLFLGSDAEQIVRIAQVPVLLVRAAGAALQPAEACSSVAEPA